MPKVPKFSSVGRTAKYRILHVMGDEYLRPLSDWYEHPWEAELVMLQHGLSGFVQRFCEGENRIRGMYLV